MDLNKAYPYSLLPKIIPSEKDMLIKQYPDISFDD